jgi:hypothetical protein
VEHKPLLTRLGLICVLGGIAIGAGCISDGSDNPDPGDGSDAIGDGFGTTSSDLSGSCPAYSASVYTPYTGTGAFPSGTVAQYPWRGTSSSYPDGNETFTAYAPLPETVECGSRKGDRKYLDVTAGCLSAVSTSSGARGQIELTSGGAYRSLAKGFKQGDSTHPVKWTDTGTEYRFYYSKPPIAEGVNPGFKAFLRYRTEYDLYVASWRADGVVQIQKKQCGTYTALEIDKHYGPPSKGAWHTIRFEAVGTKLSLWLDGKLAMTVNDATFSWGTAGIRIDSYDGAYIDNWKVYQP